MIGARVLIEHRLSPANRVLIDRFGRLRIETERVFGRTERLVTGHRHIVQIADVDTVMRLVTAFRDDIGHRHISQIVGHDAGVSLPIVTFFIQPLSRQSNNSNP